MVQLRETDQECLLYCQWGKVAVEHLLGSQGTLGVAAYWKGDMGRPLPLLYQSFQPPHLQALERVSLQSSDICVCKLLSIWHIFDGELPKVGQDNLNSLLTVWLLYTGPLTQSWPIRLQENNYTFQESWLSANQQLVKKNNKSLEEQNLIFITNAFQESKMFHHLPDWQIDNGFSKKTNHGTYSNLGTQVGACNKDFGAVSQMGLTRV